MTRTSKVFHYRVLSMSIAKCLALLMMCFLFAVDVAVSDVKPNLVEDARFEASNLWYEGAPIGNGDVGVMCYGADDILIFAIGKNDLWDRRYDQKHKPQPKPVGQIRIWQPFSHTATRRKALSPIEHNLSYQRAELLTTTSGFRVISRVQKNENVIVLQLKDIRKKTIIALDRHRDGTNTGIKAPYFYIDKELGYLIQDMPPESTYPKGFRCAAFAKCSEDVEPIITENEIRWEIEQDCFFYIGIATTRDSREPEVEAKRILTNASKMDNLKLRESHINAWEKYWQKSWIKSDDNKLVNLWYQWNYIFASATRPDAIAPGLFSPWIVNDESQWNNSYTIDYNFQQNFSATLSSNHAELMEPYFAAVERMLPAARKLAPKKYGKEGLFFPHEMYPVEIKEWPNMDGALIETLWLLQHYWDYYEYTLDREFLEKRCYPVLAECADFLARQVEKDQYGIYDITNYKSFEHPKVPNSKNGTSELGFTKYILKAAIKGASILGMDNDKMKMWQDIVTHLAPYPTQQNQLGDVFVDCIHQDSAYYVTPSVELEQGGWRPSKLAGNHGIWMYYNLAQPLLHVWPGAQIDMDSPPADLLTAIRTWMTIKLEGSNNLVPHHIQAARLGIRSYDEFIKDIEYRRMKNGFVTTKVNPVSSDFDYDWGYFQFWTYGLFIENCGIPLVINEMMLQSHNDIIRVFPTFDVYKKAEFHDLRARGGYMVSAEIDRGFVKWIEIGATVDNKCKIKLPWPFHAFEIFDLASGDKVSIIKTDNSIEFDAEKGKRYRLSPKTKTFMKQLNP